MNAAPMAALIKNTPNIDLQCIQSLKDINKKIDTAKIASKCKIAQSAATWINLKNNYLTFEEGSAFLLEHSDWPVWSKLIVNLEYKINAKTSKASLLKWFLKNPPRTIHGIHGLLGKLSVSEQKNPETKALIADFWINFNFSPTEQKSFYRQYNLLLSAEAHQQRLERLLWEENTSLAVSMIPLVPKGKRDTYKYWIAALKGKVVQDSYSTHPGIASALSQRMRKTENYLEAYKILSATQSKRAFKLSKKYLRERAIIVRELVMLKEYNKALQLAEASINICPLSSEYYTEFHWLSGWVATAYLKNPSKGLIYFKKAFDLTRSSFERAQYAFWAGYAADMGGDITEKNKWYSVSAQYPQTYYGQIANDALNRQLYLPGLNIDHLSLESFFKRPVVMMALIMNKLGHHKIKSVFLDHLAHTLQTVEEHQVGLALTKATSIPYFTFHYYEEANKLVNLAVKDNWLKVEFESTKLHHPHLIQAIVYNESRFHPKIKDSLGAIGFMQIMPTTLSHITTTNGLMKVNHNDLGSQPLRSLQLGESYLAELAERFNNSPILMTAAYNGGPSRLNTWRERFQDPVSNYDFLWLEAFPVYDTRKYIKRVISAMRLYDELGSDVPVRTIEQFLKDFESY